MASPKVIYITGTSFSGSTIMGAVLGQHPGSICAGELSNWTTYHESQEVSCSCGLKWQECSFWKKAYKLWLQESHPGWTAYQRLQSRYERLRSAVFAIPSWGLLQEEFRTYAEATRRIYTILQLLSNSTIIFDISKKVGRAKMLDRIGGMDIGYIHLIRDGRGYLASTYKHMRRRQQKGEKGIPLSRLFFLSSLEWVLINHLAEKTLTNSEKPSVRIRYEDFVKNPDSEIDRVANTFDLDLQAVKETIHSHHPIQFGHMWGGNEIRLSGGEILVLDEKWKQEIQPSTEELFWTLAGRTAQHYGYARKDSA